MGFEPTTRCLAGYQLYPLSYAPRLEQNDVRAAGLEPATTELVARRSSSELRAHQHTVKSRYDAS